MNNRSIYQQLINPAPNQIETMTLVKEEYIKFSNFWMENLEAPVSESQISQMQRLVVEHFKIGMSKDQVQNLLKLYPKFRADTAVWGLNDTETRAHLLDIIMDFFLQCPYPGAQENLSEAELLKLLQLVQDQARVLGFTLIK